MSICSANKQYEQKVIDRCDIRMIEKVTGPVIATVLFQHTFMES